MRDSLERIGIVFQKEVVDNLRDRRSIISTLLSTLITPGLLLALIVVMGKTILSEGSEKTIVLPVSGRENAPGLVQFLEQRNVRLVEAPADAENQVRQGNLDIVLVIPKDYGDSFSKSMPSNLQIIVDTSRQSGSVTRQQIQNILEQYEGLVGNLRLMARGINPVILDTLAVEQIDVSTPQSQVMIFLNMMPFLLLLVIFTGGMYVIIDTTAGERERLSLEPLLINPATRWEFVLGKFGAALPFVTAALALTLGFYAIGFNYLPIEEYIGRRMNIDFSTVVNIFLICLPIILLATALQMVLATFTRSFKEAQTYVSLMAFVPSLPGAFLAFLPTKADLGKMLIPTFGQQLLINQVLRGEPVDLSFVLISATVTVLAAGFFVYVAVRMYQRDSLIFGTR